MGRRQSIIGGKIKKRQSIFVMCDVIKMVREEAQDDSDVDATSGDDDVDADGRGRLQRRTDTMQ